MSEQSITSGVKEKTPKRVAAGKRLGAISKQAKETKRLERKVQAEVRMSADAEEDQSEEMEVDNKYALCFIGGLVMAGTVSYLYLNKDKLISVQKWLPTIPEEEEPPPKRKSKRIFDE